ncbi:CLUMA_CG017474, isoform A [Clunio marinus]|uniref:Purple acid phosphatase n=1 Tax=Clunio marinus TaxID=568069 RepID=A0A1J1IW33_9DIPT|nr:CLUMA_CG017474, isoform A [Clunio marinus]
MPKKINLIKFLCLLVYLGCVSANTLHYQPQQIHLSIGDEPNSIVVTWNTIDNPGKSMVEYGINGFILTASGTRKLFVDGGKEKHSQWIHKVTLSDLEPDIKYIYHCGSNLGWSAEFFFKTFPDGNNWIPRIALFGDMGNENIQSLPRLQEETQRGLYDAIIHVGDFAYDMNSDNARVGDEFMNQIQSIAAYVPYMTCAGNHEESFNFSNYRARFNMPGQTDNMFYSFNMGPVHFIGFSSEVYYFMNYGIKSLVNQYEWLEKDLIEANKPENRKERPWIVTFAHRPMYCSNENGDDCTHYETLVRSGLPFSEFFALEPLFYKYGVDLEFWAHEHSYERLWPIYDYKVYNGSYEEPYRNPRAPVHIITGSAGCKEGREPFIRKIPEWSAFHSQDYGYTQLYAHNSTHLELKQISVDKAGAVIDQFYVIKDEHGSYTKTD